MESFTLCKFSKSAVYASRIAKTCPLALVTKPKEKCPCEKRLYDVGPSQLRVLSCTFPETWNGAKIHDAEAFAAEFKQRHCIKDKKVKPMAEEQVAPSEAAAKETGAKAGSLMVLPQNRAHAIQTYRRIDPMVFVAQMGRAIFGSKMFGCLTVEQGQVFALTCLLEGITPMEIIRTYHMLEGKLTMRADAMLAEFMARGGEVKTISRTPDKVAFELRKDKNKQVFEFSWAEARVEDYIYTKDANNNKTPKNLPNGEANPVALKTNWSTPRRRMQMMWARLCSDGVRAMDPGVVSGTYAPEDFGVNFDETDDIIDAEIVESGTTTTVEQQKPAEPTKTEPEKPKDPPFETPAEKPAEKPAETPVKKELTAEELKIKHDALLNEFVPLKGKLFPKETDGSQNKAYLRIMENYGVTTATKLSYEQLVEIVEAFKKRDAEASPTQEIDDWIDTVLKGPSKK